MTTNTEAEVEAEICGCTVPYNVRNERCFVHEERHRAENNYHWTDLPRDPWRALHAIATCNECGAYVEDPEVHHQWHVKQEAGK